MHVLTTREKVQMIPLKERLSKYERVKICAGTCFNLLMPGDSGRFPLEQCIEKGLKVQLLVMNPSSPTAMDFYINKVKWKYDENRKIELLSKSINDLSRLINNYPNSVQAKICDVGIYYATMLLYKDFVENYPNDFVKVDLYSNATKDSDRRVIQFYRQDSEDHFNFFEQEFDDLFRESSELSTIHIN